MSNEQAENRALTEGNGENEAPPEFSAAPPPPELKSRRLEAEEDEPSYLWLVTFGDTVALMLTFFVLLYAMSDTQQDKWEDLANAVNRGFNPFSNMKFQAGPQEGINIRKISFQKALSLDYLQSVFLTVLGQEKLKEILVIPQKDHLVISMPSDLLFAPGRAEVGSRGKRALYVLGGALSNIRNRIEIVGHTDPRPLAEGNKGGFQNNWDLSLARAVNVSDILKQVGYDKPMIVRGSAQTRYQELPDTLSEEERLNLARRVDILVMKDNGASSFMVDVK